MSKIHRIMTEQGFEDISTGGGCCGWYIKKGNYTFYMTVNSELTLPKNGDHTNVSVYDKNFEHQYMTMDIMKFQAAKASEYLDMATEKMNDPEIKSQMKQNPDDIIYC